MARTRPLAPPPHPSRTPTPHAPRLRLLRRCSLFPSRIPIDRFGLRCAGAPSPSRTPFFLPACMCPSAQASYPRPDARHPPTLGQPVHPSTEHTARDAGPPLGWCAAPSPAHRAHPCLARSEREIPQHSSAPGFALGRSEFCLSAPATPREGSRRLAHAEAFQHQHQQQHQPQVQRATQTLGMTTQVRARLASVVSASHPSASSTMPSPSTSTHSKFIGLSAADMEHDRLARACGQGPILVDLRSEPVTPSGSRFGSSHRSRLSDKSTGLSAADILALPIPQDSDDPLLDIPFALSWGLRPRATSVRVPQRQSTPRNPARPRSASQPASIPLFQLGSPRGVLRSLREALEEEGVLLEDCLDVQEVFERWESQGERGSARGEAVHHSTYLSASEERSRSNRLLLYSRDIWLVGEYSGQMRVDVHRAWRISAQRSVGCVRMRRGAQPDR